MSILFLLISFSPTYALDVSFLGRGLTNSKTHEILRVTCVGGDVDFFTDRYLESDQQPIELPAEQCAFIRFVLSDPINGVRLIGPRLYVKDLSKGDIPYGSYSTFKDELGLSKLSYKALSRRLKKNWQFKPKVISFESFLSLKNAITQPWMNCSDSANPFNVRIFDYYYQPIQTYRFDSNAKQIEINEPVILQVQYIMCDDTAVVWKIRPDYFLKKLSHKKEFIGGYHNPQIALADLSRLSRVDVFETLKNLPGGAVVLTDPDGTKKSVRIVE